MPSRGGQHQQVVAAVERVGQHRGVGRDRLLLRAVGRHLVADDEAAAHRVVDAVLDLAARGVEGGEAHAVGVERQRLAAMHHQVGGLVEARSRACRPAAAARCWRGWPRARRARCSMSTVSGSWPARPSSTALSLPWPLPVAPSEPYRSAFTRAVRASSALVREARDEQARGAHRAHGVRAGRADADLEEVEDRDDMAMRRPLEALGDRGFRPPLRPRRIRSSARSCRTGCGRRRRCRRGPPATSTCPGAARPPGRPRPRASTRAATRALSSACAVCGAFLSGLSSRGQRPCSTLAISARMAIIASQKRSSSASGSLSVGSTISVPATGNDSVGAWKP